MEPMSDSVSTLTAHVQPIQDACKVIKFITSQSKLLSIFRQISSNQQTWDDANERKPTFVELIKFCETRFASRLIMLERYEALQIVIKNLVANNAYNTWLRAQDRVKQDKGKEIRDIVEDDEHWEAIKTYKRKEDNKTKAVNNTGAISSVSVSVQPTVEQVTPLIPMSHPRHTPVLCTLYSVPCTLYPVYICIIYVFQWQL